MRSSVELELIAGKGVLDMRRIHFLLVTFVMLVVSCPQLCVAGEQRFAHLFATTGTGTESDPWLGWESAIASDVDVVFIKGHFQVPNAEISLPSRVALSGVDGSIVTYAPSATGSDPMFRVPPSVQSVVFSGLQFETGFVDPIFNPPRTGAFINIGQQDATVPVQRVTIEGCRFGFVNSGIWIDSSVGDLIIRENSFDTSKNTIFFRTGSSGPLEVYERVLIQDNLMAFSTTNASLAALVSIGDSFLPGVPARFDTVTISGNTIRQCNQAFMVGIGGVNLEISANNIRSDNIDGFLQAIPPSGEVIDGFRVDDNLCTSYDSGGDPNKVTSPGCLLKLVRSQHGSVRGNYLMGGVVDRYFLILSSEIVLSGNTMDKHGTGGSCFYVDSSTEVSWTANTCIDVSGDVFDVGANSAPLSHVLFDGNDVMTTGGTSITNHFFDVLNPVSSVTARNNHVRGQNLLSTFLNGFSFTDSQLNQQSIGETGVRIGQDLVADITGTGLGVTGGTLSVTGPIDATKIADGTVTSAEFQFINSLTSNAQAQLNGKVALATIDAKGDLLVGDADNSVVRLPAGADGKFLVAQSTSAAGLGFADQKYDLSYFRQVGSNPERLYIASHLSGPLSSSSLSAIVLRAAPFLSGRGGVIDQLGADVAMAKSGKFLRVCIYDNASDVNLYPTSLVLDSGALSTSSAGFVSASVNQALSANKLYWIAHFQDFAVTVGTVPSAQAIPLLGISATNDSPGLGWSAPVTFGSCPTTFPSGGSVVTGALPAVGIRYSN